MIKMATTEELRIMSDIERLCVLNRDVVHAFSGYAGHIHSFSLRAYTSNRDYSNPKGTASLIREIIFLDKHDSISKLNQLRSQLLMLIKAENASAIMKRA